MTTVIPPRQLQVRPRPALLLLCLAFQLGQISTVAQTDSDPPASPTKEHNSAESDPGQSLAAEWTDAVRFTNQSASHYYNSIPPTFERPFHYFPPTPPPLNAEFPFLGPLASGPSAPRELAPFVDELFYPALATRLAEDDLPKEMRIRLQAYRAEKVRLQNELRAKIAELKDLAPPSRDRQLAVFAALQSPQIVALEERAEKIRAELGRSGILGLPTDATDWTLPPDWRQRSGASSHEPPVEQRLESAALLGAAFYEEGLTAAQRRLLRAAAIELEAEANPVAGSERNSAEGWLLDFSPEPARIRILANLPAPLAKKISDYVSKKKELQGELRDALRGNRPSGGTARLEVLRKLAVTQASRIPALESIAEEIRGDLAALPNSPGPPAPPELPPELISRISVYRIHKVELLKTLYAMLAGSAATPSPAQNSTDEESGKSAERAHSWMRDGATSTVVRPEYLKVPTDEFKRRQNELIGGLNRELAGIRESLAEYVRSANQPADRKSVNDLLKDFEDARQKQEIWDKYRDYQTAVLLPGLSPEQRRLLFSAAVEQLALPLPAGERAK